MFLSVPLCVLLCVLLCVPTLTSQRRPDDAGHTRPPPDAPRDVYVAPYDEQGTMPRAISFSLKEEE